MFVRHFAVFRRYVSNLARELRRDWRRGGEPSRGGQPALLGEALVAQFWALIRALFGVMDARNDH